MGTDRVKAAAALDAVSLRDRIAQGAMKAADAVEGCLAQVADREPEVQAWAWIDPEFARLQARGLDAHRATGRPLGALHGVPVGVKDVIDVARAPGENGCPLDAGRKPSQDAFVVERLKAAGAVILGKTTTTELAFLAPSKTRNPHNPAHTPGGSSAGSAAAVAAAMVPLAVGTQTGGSVIRPASYCGVVGFKPSFGAIPRRGVLMQSQSLDTVGVFARSVADAALIAETLFGADPADSATAPAPHPRLLETALSQPPVTPTLAFVRLPGWDGAHPDTHAAFEELCARLGEQVFEAPLPRAFEDAAAIRARINFAEMARCYHRYARDGFDRLAAETQQALQAGAEITAKDYLAALDWRGVFNAALDEIFGRADAILCPAATGPAPEGLGSTGDAIFNGLWTLCGVPAVTIPALAAGNDMPMGVQLVGRRGDDARLLRTARWLNDALADGRLPEGSPR